MATAKKTGEMGRSIEDYLTACRARGVKPSTIRDAYGFPLRSVFLPWCESQGISRPSQVDQRTLEVFAAELAERRTKAGKPLSENSVWTYRKSVNQFLAWVAEESGGPPARVSLRKPPGRRLDILERAEIRELERAAPVARDQVIIRLLADTGIRPGELVSITGADVQRSGRRHYVHVDGKSGQREVPVSSELYKSLRSLVRGDDEPVFVGVRRDPRTGEREPLTVNGVRQAIRDLALDVGLGKQVTPYTFRHSACRWMLLNGMSTVEVATILGHGSERMIQEHYHNIGASDAHDRLMTILRLEE